MKIHIWLNEKSMSWGEKRRNEQKNDGNFQRSSLMFKLLLKEIEISLLSLIKDMSKFCKKKRTKAQATSESENALNKETNGTPWSSTSPNSTFVNMLDFQSQPAQCMATKKNIHFAPLRKGQSNVWDFCAITAWCGYSEKTTNTKKRE